MYECSKFTGRSIRGFFFVFFFPFIIHSHSYYAEAKLLLYNRLTSEVTCMTKTPKSKVWRAKQITTCRNQLGTIKRHDVFDLLPLHDIVPNAEFFEFFGRSDMLIYTYINIHMCAYMCVYVCARTCVSIFIGRPVCLFLTCPT